MTTLRGRTLRQQVSPTNTRTNESIPSATLYVGQHNVEHKIIQRSRPMIGTGTHDDMEQEERQSTDTYTRHVDKHACARAQTRIHHADKQAYVYTRKTTACSDGTAIVVKWPATLLQQIQRDLSTRDLQT
eukprot:scpid93077/ scgid13625/ 